MRSRYNHSKVFYNDLMIILGGKGINSSGNNPLPIEVFPKVPLEMSNG